MESLVITIGLAAILYLVIVGALYAWLEFHNDDDAASFMIAMAWPLTFPFIVGVYIVRRRLDPERLPRAKAIE